MELKEGDIIICHTICITKPDNVITTTIGKSYIITTVGTNSIYIINDLHESHSFSLQRNDSSYEKWFDTLVAMRKKKLEKLNSFE